MRDRSSGFLSRYFLFSFQKYFSSASQKIFARNFLIFSFAISSQFLPNVSSPSHLCTFPNLVRGIVQGLWLRRGLANLLLFLVALFFRHILAELDLDGGAGIDSVGGTGRVRNRHAHVAFNLSTGGHRNGEASFRVDVLAFKL